MPIYGRLSSFQARCHDWVARCIGREHANDITVRCHRFFEEAAELVQSLGMSRHEAHQLVDYVFGREVGEPAQEVGGTMTTLGTLCAAAGLDLERCAENELAKVNAPERMERIRRKHFAKPALSALPQAGERPLAYADTEALLAELRARGLYASDDRVKAEIPADQVDALRLQLEDAS